MERPARKLKYLYISTLMKRRYFSSPQHYAHIGAEETFKGLVDLIKMKAIYWHDETMAVSYTHLATS